MLQLRGETAAGLEASLGSAAGGIAAWLVGATVGDDGELASIAGAQTTVRLRLVCLCTVTNQLLFMHVLMCTCCLNTSMVWLMRKILQRSHLCTGFGRLMDNIYALCSF